MKCPYCGNAEQKVLDSRPAREGTAVRRRRECDHCQRRFTTFEEPEKPRVFVVKRDGTREDFSREKLMGSMLLACGKRPVAIQDLEHAVTSIERHIFDEHEQEISTSEIGELVTDELYRIDSIAYIRYSSVYRGFECPQQFAEIVRRMQKEERARTAESKPNGKASRKAQPIDV